MFFGDPRTQDYFLIKSPWGYLSIILFYLYFVYELGPNIMAKRKPFNLDKILQIYNLIQIVSCGYIFYKVRENIKFFFLIFYYSTRFSTRYLNFNKIFNRTRYEKFIVRFRILILVIRYFFLSLR